MSVSDSDDYGNVRSATQQRNKTAGPRVAASQSIRSPAPANTGRGAESKYDSGGDDATRIYDQCLRDKTVSWTVTRQSAKLPHHQGANPSPTVSVGDLVSGTKSCIATAMCDVVVLDPNDLERQTDAPRDVVTKGSSVQLFYPMIPIRDGVYMRMHGVDAETGALESRLACIQTSEGERTFNDFRTPYDQWTRK